MNDVRFKEWFARGVEIGATHMIVIGDLKSWNTFPAYVYPNWSVLSATFFYNRHPDYVVLQVFSCYRSFDDQLQIEKEETIDRKSYGYCDVKEA